MAGELNGARIAFLVANEGIEEVELTQPWEAVKEAGALPSLIAPEGGRAQAMRHLDKADTFPVDHVTAEVTAGFFDGFVLPGGVANPDRLRTDRAAVGLVKTAFDAGKPFAAICHAPWMLIEADVVRDRRLTSWPSLRTDIENAGGRWVDEEVQVCTAGPNTLITSRRPDDLKVFCQATVDAFRRYRTQT